ncbi:imidazolonepropionase [Parapedobacter deserti]|uniref:Imidazolonepropionase n=1 Tax=Parapedobacter deserti TaxID=1912957 RepID=A0ABV7JL99_9SPHI
MKRIGPFSQVVTLRRLPLKGPIADDQLEIITNGGIVVDNGYVRAVGRFDELGRGYPHAAIEEIHGNHTLVPGFIDCHTHICFAGNRARDYAMRVAGRSYLDIAAAGGGIWDSVLQTRAADPHELALSTAGRANRLLQAGVTSIEVKSGYGLSADSELAMLRAIAKAREHTPADLIPTCLAAHMKPRDFSGDESAYIDHILMDLLPVVRNEGLAQRVDIFIEASAFKPSNGRYYLQKAKSLGFVLTVHADQFSTGGAEVAVQCGAVSADHLEASTDQQINLLSRSNTVAVVLPGASMGLGMGFAPARRLLNAGACVAIASDWNPGSAPMGDLLTQAAVLGAYEKLTLAETLAGLTFRAAMALKLSDRGTLDVGSLADVQAYPTADYRDILYNQGSLKPMYTWKKGIRCQ